MNINVHEQATKGITLLFAQYTIYKDNKKKLNFQNSEGIRYLRWRIWRFSQ